MTDSPSATPGAGPSVPTPPALAHRSSEHHAKFGRSTNLFFHEDSGEREPPRRISDLVQKPVIRQWIENGKLYREASPREISRFELFFDLLFVGIIHYLAEAAVEPHPGGPAVARFILTFWPSWSIWEEARRYANVSGTDDLLHRVWVLVGMICLLGYSVSATAIELEPHGEEIELDHSGVHCAAAFWLIIKLTRVLVLWYYAWSLPRFRRTQFLSGCAVLIPMFVYLPLVWVTNRKAQIILASLGIAVDLIRFDGLFYYLSGRLQHWRAYKADQKRVAAGEIASHEAAAFQKNPLTMVPYQFCLPAVNIEHSIERSSAFVTIVLGEFVMNLLYVPTKGEFGASHKYGKAVLGLMIAWAFNYFYTMPSETPFEYLHALRRSWFTGLIFSFLHWPLCAALLLASASAAKMVAEDDVEVGVKWYWGAGLGFSLLFIALIDMLHHRVEPWTSERIPRVIRFIFATLCALCLILVPLAGDRLSSIEVMGIATAVTWTVLAVYIIGTLPTRRARLLLEEEQGVPEEPLIIETEMDRNLENLERVDSHTHTVRSRKSRKSFRHSEEHESGVASRVE